VATGDLPAVRLGGRVFFRHVDLEAISATHVDTTGTPTEKSPARRLAAYHKAHPEARKKSKPAKGRSRK
jgi:hypothetical protein